MEQIPRGGGYPRRGNQRPHYGFQTPTPHRPQQHFIQTPYTPNNQQNNFVPRNGVYMPDGRFIPHGNLPTPSNLPTPGYTPIRGQQGFVEPVTTFQPGLMNQPRVMPHNTCIPPNAFVPTAQGSTFAPNQQRRLQPGNTIQTAKNIYTIVEVLVAPHPQDERMNDGVYVVRHQNGELRTAKFIKMITPAQNEQATKEKIVLQQLSDAGRSYHINYVYESYWGPGSNHGILILEYCELGSLEDHINNMRATNSRQHESVCWRMLAHLSAALSMAHYGVRDPLKKDIKIQKWNTICHLDMKPANVFSTMKQALGHEDETSARFVLGDFGCAVTRSDIVEGKVPDNQQPGGTDGWFPPETFIGSETIAKGKFGKPTDIWQLGGIIQATCRLIDNPDQCLVNIGNPCGSFYSAELNGAVAHCMNRDPKMRPSAVDLAEEAEKQLRRRGWS